ncbi:aryl-alcohol dehydrogenase AAD14 [Paraphaeosphaeria sporulosa]
MALEANKGLRSFFSEEQIEDEARASAVLEAVALVYVMQKARYVFPMIGGWEVEHLHDNIKSLSLQLSDEQLQKLDGVNDIGLSMTFVSDDPHENGGKQNFLLKTTAKMAWHQHGKPIGHE